MSDKFLVLRTPSGISGDMLLAGLASLLGSSKTALDKHIESLGIPSLNNCLRIEKASVNEVAGWQAKISLPHEHAHRSFSDIKSLIEKSALSANAKSTALRAFELLAQAEGAVHNIAPENVTFHEVGALDSILDVCLVAAFFDELSPKHFICSPLPICDGVIHCEHGTLAAPAPAVLALLKDVPVVGIDSEGETITPTAIALLKAMNASFDLWPSLTIEKSLHVYGSRILPNIPNGAIFAYGSAHSINYNE